MNIKAQTKLWTTKDGTILHICDMTDEHLLNAIRFLQRKAEMRRIHKVNFYVNGPKPQGEMAYDCYMMEFDWVTGQATWENYVHPLHYNMVLEARRRGLGIPHQETRVDVELGVITAAMEKRG